MAHNKEYYSNSEMTARMLSAQNMKNHKAGCECKTCSQPCTEQDECTCDIITGKKL